MDLSFLDPIGGLRTVIAVVVVLFAIALLRKLFTPPQQVKYSAPGRCLACDWVGTVSKHAPKCPKCGARITL